MTSFSAMTVSPVESNECCAMTPDGWMNTENDINMNSILINVYFLITYEPPFFHVILYSMVMVGHNIFIYHLIKREPSISPYSGKVPYHPKVARSISIPAAFQTQ